MKAEYILETLRLMHPRTGRTEGELALHESFVGVPLAAIRAALTLLVETGEFECEYPRSATIGTAKGTAFAPIVEAGSILYKAVR